jgi:hypothetical protein
MVPGLPTVDLTVIRAATVVERGTPILDWGNATEHTLARCIVHPVVGEEVHDNRDAVVNRWKVFVDGGDITALDRVRYQGIVCDVDGDIQSWPGPIPALTHLEFELERVQG